MSTLAIPMPKTAGGRPPFGGPPSQTTFDSRPDDDGEPIHRRIQDSVQQTLNACQSAEPEMVPTLLRIISQRKEMVERELSMLRMLDSDVPLPPLISNFYALEISDDSDVVRLYLRLLDNLDEEATRLRQIADRQIG